MGKPGLSGKKLLLALHLVFAGIMLGAAVIFLTLSIGAASTTDEAVFRACYTVMNVLAESTVRASTLLTIAKEAQIRSRGVTSRAGPNRTRGKYFGRETSSQS